MSKKLDEIDCVFEGRIQTRPILSAEVRWLIARARRCEKLEAALTSLRAASSETWLHLIVDNALKED